MCSSDLGQFSAYERDVFADAEESDRKRIKDYWWMPFGRFKGQSFGKIPVWYLKSILPHCRDENLAGNIRRHLMKRASA